MQKLDFITSVGYLDGGDARTRLGPPGHGPTKVITDLGVLTPDPDPRAHADAAPSRRRRRAGARADRLAAEGRGRPQDDRTPSEIELEALRALHRRTRLAHAEGAAA